MVHVEGELRAQPPRKALYDEQYRIYRGIYEAIANAGQYQALSGFSARHF